MSETFFKPGDRVDIFFDGRWKSHPSYIVQSDCRLVTVKRHSAVSNFEPSSVRLHAPTPEIGAEVQRKEFDVFYSAAVSCRFLGEFHDGNQRFWALAVKYDVKSEVQYVVEPASAWEVAK